MAKFKTSVIVAAAVGLAAGISIGILLAPAKGSRTRKRLKKQIIDLAEAVESSVSQKLQGYRHEQTGESDPGDEDTITSAENNDLKPEGK